MGAAGAFRIRRTQGALQRATTGQTLRHAGQAVGRRTQADFVVVIAASRGGTGPARWSARATMVLLVIGCCAGEVKVECVGRRSGRDAKHQVGRPFPSSVSYSSSAFRTQPRAAVLHIFFGRGCFRLPSIGNRESAPPSVGIEDEYEEECEDEGEA